MVKIYTTNSCGYCQKAKEWFKEKGLDFQVIDVGTNKEEAFKMVKNTGQMTVPVIDIEGHYVIGFNPTKFQEFLQ